MIIMKNKNIKIFSCCVAVFFSISCNDLLKEKPYGIYSNDNFFNTEADALSALLYAYDPINNIEYGARFLFNLTDLTTNQYKSYNKGLETSLYTWDVNPSTDEFLYFFKYAYIGILRANSVLENVSRMTNIPTLSKQQILGEAYFLRAFHYFMLVRTYGKVPLHLKTVNSANEAQAQYASIEEIYQTIINDLEQAISLMGIQKQQGRVDKVAAQSLLAKVYLTLASSKMTGAPGYEWVTNYEEMYQFAANYANEVVNNQDIYGLESELEKVYDIDYQSMCKEHIFITSMYREGKGEEGNFSQLPPMYGIGLPTVYISSSLRGGNKVQLYMASGYPGWSYYRVDNNFYHSFDNNDLRKKLMVTTIYNQDGSILAEWSENNINSSNPTLNAFYYPFCRKYTDPHSIGWRSSANLYLIRFAEVALTYAEAVGPTEQGYYWVNQVRHRANLSDLTPGLSKIDFRKKIWDELTFELAFEGHGLFELRRTNRVLEEITNKQVKEEYAYFFPIPQREIDLNPMD